MISYFIVDEEQSTFCSRKGSILEFVPAKSFRRNDSPYFGGYLVDEPDDRPFEELVKDSEVQGIILLEGGHGIRRLKGSQLFRTKADAEASKSFS